MADAMRMGWKLVLLCCATLPTTAVFGQVQFLKQNWNDATRQLFYTTSQGSRLIRYEWALALETSDGTDSFLEKRVPQLGYLPNDSTIANPDRLPVGFVVDTDVFGNRYLGLNCAACHTNRVQYLGKTFQIDGAPTQADIWGLLSGIRDSLASTAADEAKFARFVQNVLPAGSQSGDIAILRSELRDSLVYWNQFIQASNPDPRGQLTWGRARLDAFGMIFNRVSSIDLGIPSNSTPPNAPVSYPFLWGASAENRVQWNASAPNHNDIERLGRNVGEVLGVFAATDLQKASLLRPYYRTSARRLNQVRMENWLKTLWSPRWPDDFPAIDPAKRDAGKLLFDNNCARCHEVVPYGEQARPVKIVVTPVGQIGTDRRMAANSIARAATTGRLEGSALPPEFSPLPAKMQTQALVTNIVVGAIISPFHDIETNPLALLRLSPASFRLQRDRTQLTEQEIHEFLQATQIDNLNELLEKTKLYQARLDAYKTQIDEFNKRLIAGTPTEIDPDNDPFVYKARPLDGIWATGPYLHNGSVANLYELLLPADRRTKVFHVGNLEFDPVKVGFSKAPGLGTTELDTNIEGNFNTGHDQYGNDRFTEDERMQLVEYMKSL